MKITDKMIKDAAGLIPGGSNFDWEDRLEIAREILTAALSQCEQEPVGYGTAFGLKRLQDTGSHMWAVSETEGHEHCVALYTSPLLIQDARQQSDEMDKELALILNDQSLVTEADQKNIDMFNAAIENGKQRLCSALPQDVIDLVIAARIVAFEDQSQEALKVLDKASEAFAERVPWDNDPSALKSDGL